MRRILISVFLLAFAIHSAAGSALTADRLRVGYPSLATALSPTWIASRHGFWKKQNLDVEMIFLSGRVIIASLLGGNIDIVIGSDTSTAIANIKGANILRLGVTTNSLGSSLVTQQHVESFDQLRGATIGIGSAGFSSLELRLSKLLLDNGIDPEKDVKFLPIGGGPSARVATLNKNLVIAAMITPPYDLVARESGMKIFAKIDAPVIAGGVNVQSDYLQNNREKLVRFLKGYMEAIHFLLNNREKSIKVFSDYLGTRDAKVLAHFYDEIAGRVEKDLRPDPDSVRFTLDFVGRVYPKAKELKVTEYSDLSLIEEIEKSGFLQKLYGAKARR
jgi:NitT/TauT family transport system substrate-binding protein